MLQVIYCASVHRPADPEVTLEGRHIPLLNVAKCLGLTVHSKITRKVRAERVEARSSEQSGQPKARSSEQSVQSSPIKI